MAREKEEIYFVENDINYVRTIVRNKSGKIILNNVTPKGAKDRTKHEKLKKEKLVKYTEMDHIIKELLGPIDTVREKELRFRFMTILTENEQPNQSNTDDKFIPRM